MKKVVLFLCLLQANHVYTAPLNTESILAVQKQFKAQQDRRSSLYDAGVKAGAALLCVYLGYVGYAAWANKAPVFEFASKEFFEHNKANIEAAIELGKAERISWANSTTGWVVKTVGGIIVQSMVLQALEPLYNFARCRILHEVSLPIARFWFLAEQREKVGMNGEQIKLSQELARFIVSIDAVEVAYRESQATLLSEPAEYIVGHLLFFKEQVPGYQQYLVQKIVKSFESLVQQMLEDAEKGICDQEKIESFKEILRGLYSVNAYCVR